MRQFYLAAGYSARRTMKQAAERIAARAAGWQCCSRWLEGGHDNTASSVCGDDDLEDVRAADAMVVFHGPSTRGGKWVELGIAIERRIPILLVGGGNQPPAPPVFAFTIAVTWAESNAESINIAEWLVALDNAGASE